MKSFWRPIVFLTIIIVSCSLPVSAVETHLRGEKWKNNTLGLSDHVLPPWTPIRINDNYIECWGRRYRFSEGPLPTQILSAEKELLSRPINMIAFKGGNLIPLTSKLSQIERTHQGKEAVITGNLFDKKGGKIEVNAILEYDGLLLITFSATRLDLMNFDTLQLDIPIQSDRTLYRHRWTPAWEGLSGSLPSKKGVVDRTSFIPFYWLGDNDRGLFWFCESDEMWPNGKGKDAIEVIRSEAETVLRLNLKKKGQAFPDNWRLVIGLQATPVKPLPRDWRKLRLDPARNANVSILWPTPTRDSFRFYGYPEAADSKAFSSRVKKLQSNGIKVVPYLCLTYLSTETPEWKQYGDKWGMGWKDEHSKDVKAFGSSFAMVSPSAESWSDFILWKTKEFLQQFPVDGVYHDNTQIAGSSSLKAGVGYQRGGTLNQTFPMLAYRNLYRRMYSVLKELPRPTVSIAHMSGKMNIPVLAYEDAYLDGEHFRGKVKDDYLEVLSLDAFRAEHMGRQWGVVPIFLPEFRPPYSEMVEPTRGLMALLMIHDVIPWPLWCNKEVVNYALGALDAFGYAEAEFIPYFDPDPPATANGHHIYASAYRRKDGMVLLVATNLGRHDWEGSVRVHVGRLGVRKNQAMTWPAQKPLPMQNGNLQIQIPRQGYRMILLDPERKV